MRSGFLILTALLCARGAASACEPHIPDPFTVKSPDGKVSVDVVPPVGSGEPSVTVRRTGQPAPLWRMTLPETARLVHGAAVSNRGAVALFTIWGYGNVRRPQLLVYDETGKERLERRLEELLDPAQMKAIQDEMCGAYWVGPQPVRLDDDVLHLTLRDGVDVDLRLADGAQERDGKRFDVPDDAVRLRGYLDGTRRASLAGGRLWAKDVECSWGDESAVCDRLPSGKSWVQSFSGIDRARFRDATRAAAATSGEEILWVCFADTAQYCYWISASPKGMAAWRQLLGIKR